MSKQPASYRTTPAIRSRWLVPGVALGLAVVLVGALVIFSGNNQEPFAPRVTGAPRAEVDQVSVDLGTFALNAFADHTFRIGNVGDEPLYILGEPRVELVEGCCPPRALVGSNTLMPGEETTVSVRFTMHEGMGGPHEFRVHVLTTDPTQEDIPLTVISDWETA